MARLQFFWLVGTGVDPTRIAVSLRPALSRVGSPSDRRSRIIVGRLHQRDRLDARPLSSQTEQPSECQLRKECLFVLLIVAAIHFNAAAMGIRQLLFELASGRN